MSIQWKELFSSILLISLNWISRTGAVKFTSSSPSSITAVKGQGVWFSWVYDLEGASLVQYQCGKHDTSLNKLDVQSEGANEFKTLTKWQHKVITYNGNKTFALWNVSYSDAGTYYCQITFNSGSITSMESSRSVLTVEGKPEFCDPAPVTSLDKKEGEDASISVTLCGLPAPTVKYRWIPDTQTSSESSTLVGGSSFKHSATITEKSLNRQRCGKRLAYLGQNSRGQSVEKETTVNVRFIPVSPKSVKAYYTSNGDCVKCEWNAQESGSCKINYKVEFLDLQNKVLQTKSGENLLEATACNIGVNSTNVTSVNVTASTSEGTAYTVFKVSVAPPTSTPTNPPNGGGSTGESSSNVYIIVGCVVGGIIIITLIVVGIMYAKKKKAKRIGGPKNGNRPPVDSTERPNKQSEYASVGIDPYQTDKQLYAEARQQVVYGKLGAGGGRTGPRVTKPTESNYADIKLDDQGYPAVGPTATSHGGAIISEEQIV